MNHTDALSARMKHTITPRNAAKPALHDSNPAHPAPSPAPRLTVFMVVDQLQSLLESLDVSILDARVQLRRKIRASIGSASPARHCHQEQQRHQPYFPHSYVSWSNPRFSIWKDSFFRLRGFTFHQIMQRIFPSARGVRGKLKTSGSIGRLATGYIWLNGMQLSSGAVPSSAPVFSDFLSSREIKNPFPGLPRVSTLSPEVSEICRERSSARDNMLRFGSEEVFLCQGE